MKLKHLCAILIVGAASTVIAAPPANDNFANAQTITGATGTAAGTNVEATLESGEVNYGNHSIWYNWTAPSNGLVEFNTNGSNFDTRLYASTGTAVNNLNGIDADNDGGANNGESLVSFSVTQGALYRIRVSGFGTGVTAPTTLNWSLQVPPANDAFATATVLTGASGTSSGNTVLATTESGEANFQGSNSVWFTWTAPFTGTVQFDTFGSPLDSILSIGSGGTLANYVIVSENDDSVGDTSGNGNSRVRVPVTNGVTYRVRLSDYYGGGAYSLQWVQTMFVPSVISFTSSTFTVGEATATKAITFTRTLGTDNDAVSVDFSTDDGSADGNDYNAVNQTVSFATGVTTASVNVTINQDPLIEGEETVGLFFRFHSETAIMGPPATLVIEDDEPFIPVKSAYRGYIRLATFENAFSGVLGVNSDGKGGFTGSLQLGGAKYPFKGVFDAKGTATVAITGKNGAGNLTLRLASAAASSLIRCTLGDSPTRKATFELERIIYNKAFPFSEKDERFTVYVPGDRAALGDVPRGDGFLSIVVSKIGGVKVLGCLSDGTAISAGGPIVAYADMPLYAPLYKGTGSFSGNLRLDPQDSGRSAETHWFKPASPLGKAFKAGFSFPSGSSTYPYAMRVRSPILTALFSSNNVMEFVAEKGGLPNAGLKQLFVLTEENVAHFPLAPTVKLTLKVVGKTGLYSGTFQTGSEKPTEFKGAFFQDYDFASGFFLGNSAGIVTGGAVSLYPVVN